jgi:hypothetical protein
MVSNVRFDQESALTLTLTLTLTHFSEIFDEFLGSIKVLFFFSHLVTIYYRNKPCFIQAHSVYVHRKMAHNVYIKFMPLVKMAHHNDISKRAYFVYFLTINTNFNKT